MSDIRSTLSAKYLERFRTIDSVKDALRLASSIPITNDERLAYDEVAKEELRFILVNLHDMIGRAHI